MRIVVTGANGFVGRALVRRLAGSGHQLLEYVRPQPSYICIYGVTTAAAPDLGPYADWRLRPDLGIDVLVHLAARVHIMQDNANDPLVEYRKVNVAGTLNLAHQAVHAGVRRFIFLSSVKVNGEYTLPSRPLSEDYAPYPQDAYGLSK